jgi:phage terminase large subunit-like protein
VFIWIPRKNGKTEFAAGLALLMLLGDAEPGGQVFSIAAEKDQASIVFNKATSMVSYSATLNGRLECLKPSIYCPQLNASFKPLSGKPAGKHGLNMSGLIGDEIHEWRNGDLYTFVHDSAAARRQPLEVLISTARVKGTHGEEVWDECQAHPGRRDRGAGHPGGDLRRQRRTTTGRDPEVWARANPNLGVSVKADALAEACKLAQQLPRLENDFKRYRLNILDRAGGALAADRRGRRQRRAVRLGPMRRARGVGKLEAFLSGKRCFGGLDLSAINDLSALVWWFPIQEGLEFPGRPAAAVQAGQPAPGARPRDRLPYERWA